MRKISYAGYRFPPEVIHQAIWLYLRYTLSFRDVEDLLAERGIVVSYETVRPLGEALRTALSHLASKGGLAARDRFAKMLESLNSAPAQS
jgi:transposase-like protein